MASLILVLPFVGTRYPDSGFPASSPKGIAPKVEGKAAFATALRSLGKIELNKFYDIIAFV
jgi:hypothetical protein